MKKYDTQQFDLPNEEWRDFVRYPQTRGVYYISNLGRYKRRFKKRFNYSQGASQIHGYKYVCISIEGENIANPKIHDLIAEAFIRPIDFDKEECHHINHIRSDNRLQNLQILTKEEHRGDPITSKKKSNALKGHQGWNEGKKHSEETKQKMREAKLGKKQSEETKRKRSNSLKGHIVTEETRQKISIANKTRRKRAINTNNQILLLRSNN